MTTTSVVSTTGQWLQANALLDDGLALADVRLHIGGPLSWYLRLVKKSAITVGANIWFVSEAKRDDLALLAHELVHVGQYREMGVPRFLARYGRDMLKAGFRYSRKLPLEAPAYERQALAKRILAAGPPVDE